MSTNTPEETDPLKPLDLESDTNIGNMLSKEVLKTTQNGMEFHLEGKIPQDQIASNVRSTIKKSAKEIFGIEKKD